MNKLIKKIIDKANIDIRHIENHANIDDFEMQLEDMIKCILVESEKHIAQTMTVSTESDKKSTYQPGQLLEHFGFKNIKNENLS